MLILNCINQYIIANFGNKIPCVDISRIIGSFTCCYKELIIDKFN